MTTQLVQRLVDFFARDVSLVLWDLADILLVAAVLYYVLLLIKGTRAMQIGVGLLFVFVVYQVSKRMGLLTLYSILDTLLTSLVLIIVVIFQNEIRRALMRFGRRPFFALASPVATTRVIEEVVKAATALAQKRLGGLIVFERDAVVDEFIEPGTPLDAELSWELLYSVFLPTYENPLHDGAVIIRDGRARQAGAFLPLTSGRGIDRSLGTRHRAGIGLSEETDAVVVVVSEERGAISLCFNGNIVSDLDASALRTALTGLLVQRAKRRGGREESGARSSRESLTGRESVTGRESSTGSEERTPSVAPEGPKTEGVS